jgi:predicted O-methyltransferase YrrM
MNERIATAGLPAIPDFDWDAINSGGTWGDKDFVTNKLKHWIPLFAPRRHEKLSILEIGSFEGRSALFFLSFFPNARLTCVDPFIKGRGAVFDDNTAPYSERLTKLVGYSGPELMKLTKAKAEFDIAYIDGSHKRKDVLLDSVLVWPMMRNDGIVIWDDYGGYSRDKAPDDRALEAINGFLVAYADQIELLHKKNQVFARKVV